MKKEKLIKISAIVSYIISAFIMLFGVIFLPDPIGFLIIISGAALIAITIITSKTIKTLINDNALIQQEFDVEYSDYKAKRKNIDDETELHRQKMQTEYDELQNKMESEYDEHLKKMQSDHEEYEKNKSLNAAEIQAEIDKRNEELKTAEQEIASKRNELIEFENEIKKRNEDLESKEKTIILKITKLRQIEENLNKRETEIKFAESEAQQKIKEKAEMALYNFENYSMYSSQECKNEETINKVKQEDIIKQYSKLLEFEVFNNFSEKKRAGNEFKKIIRCFNSESINIIKNLNSNNIDGQREKINRSFKTLNKLFNDSGVKIPIELLELKLEELNLRYTYEIKKQQELEEQREIRKIMLEEARVREEIAIEKEKVAKDERQFKNELSKLLNYMNQSQVNVEKEIYAAKIKELEEKLSKLEAEKNDINIREHNARAGYVYIISNIGSFGENIYKIGMTRRLEPMDRIKELGSASVPFPFDVHAMIFSDDAPALETTLHNYFRERSVNLINPKKEFFNVTLEEIKEIVTKEHNNTVVFQMTAVADEYNKTLEMKKSKSAVK